MAEIAANKIPAPRESFGLEFTRVLTQVTKLYISNFLCFDGESK